jgi:hypothetical protein
MLNNLETAYRQKQDEAGRFEFKYRISFHEYLNVRNSLLPYMRMDHFTNRTEHHRYFVRSLYFETPSFQVYKEKLSGDMNRVKLRLRTYEEHLAEASAVRVELKVRRGETLAKYHTFISIEAYEQFMTSGHWGITDDQVLIEFDRYRYIKAFRPAVLVDYLREGYESRGDEGVRITFDHLVRSAHEKTLFPDRPFFRVHHPNEVVLEIKCRDYSVPWLKRIIHNNGLKLVANSKFTQAIEASRHDQYYPDGVVIVR